MPKPIPKPTTPTTPTCRLLAGLALTVAVAPAALAQYEITIDIENPTLRPGESTVVTMYAGYQLPDYAVAFITSDLVTTVGSQGWSDAMVLEPMDTIGSQAGFPSATGYDQILAGQLQFHSVYADPTNPIGFWKATYTAPLETGAPFDIELSTMTTQYRVYWAVGESSSESRLDELVEGSATIHVIPAPATVSLLALGLIATRRRRA